MNEWIDQLQNAFDPDQLKEETDKINCILSTKELVQYYKTKTESTESSPSGRHMGHYKLIIHNEDLTSLITAMLNIGLLTGNALKRWKRTLSAMLKKRHWPTKNSQTGDYSIV